jgi:3',5'-cyclic AMP phosphodiesterase CpdA
MRLGHLSDLHLRDIDDLDRFHAQLRNMVRADIDHLVITGDLLERWDTPLLDGAFDVLRARDLDLFRRDRLTIIHGNHDLVSVGAPHSPRERNRLLVRFWDPEPLLVWRRRRFYARIQALFDAPVTGLPFIKRNVHGIDLVAIDTVPTRFRPIAVQSARTASAGARRGLRGARIELRHALGTVRERDAAWLSALGPRTERPRVLLLHHYPLPTPPLTWRRITVPMEIPPSRRDLLWRAAEHADVRLILCGHVHRARLERVGNVSVGLEGTSGGAWADFGGSVYEIDASGAVSKHEKHTGTGRQHGRRRAV